MFSWRKITLIMCAIEKLNSEQAHRIADTIDSVVKSVNAQGDGEFGKFKSIKIVNTEAQFNKFLGSSLICAAQEDSGVKWLIYQVRNEKIIRLLVLMDAPEMFMRTARNIDKLKRFMQHNKVHPLSLMKVVNCGVSETGDPDDFTIVRYHIENSDLDRYIIAPEVCEDPEFREVDFGEIEEKLAVTTASTTNRFGK